VNWRLRIRHRTGFRYSGEVASSYNEARVTPLTTPTQTTLESRVEVSPAATTYRYWDYWGTQVTAFDVHVPHTELTVTATSVVETAAAGPADPPVGWAELADERLRDRLVEFLEPTSRTAVDEELAAVAEEATRGLDPADAGLALAARVRDDLEYVPGATGVHTSAVEAWRERKGVCQDLAHLTVALLRSRGLPARYVSGYLHPAPDSAVGETVAGEGHAWVEWWDGNWTAYDPTNGVPAREQHVVVGRGREYGDVPPLKGIYSGGSLAGLGVTVEVTRLA
jgi:transglutaminase-like putative cysteine protease